MKIKSGEIGSGKRLLNISINALFGYLIVELIGFLARVLGIIDTEYSDIIILSSIVNGATLFFIVIVYKMKNPSERTVRIIFLAELLLYFTMYSVALVKVQEFRIFGLVFALVAITIELPFTRYRESIMIIISSVVAQVLGSYCAITFLHQRGSFMHAFFYTICFMPILIIISYVSRQLTNQKYRINMDKKLLTDMNDRLMQTNAALEKTNSIAQMEIDLAAQVQKLLLPPVPENIHGWDIAMSFMPKYGVSGDFYDFYYKNSHLSGMAIFDVSGHGVSSSLVTMIVKPLTYRIFNRMETGSMGDIIHSINEKVSAEISMLEHFISCILLRFNGNTVEYANAGHPDLVLKRAESGLVQVIDVISDHARGGPIGIHPVNYKPAFTSFNMEKNDSLLLYTDCIIESRDINKARYGFKRLSSSFQEAPGETAHDTLAFILERFFSFTRGQEIRDDFTVIVAKKTN